MTYIVETPEGGKLLDDDGNEFFLDEPTEEEVEAERRRLARILDSKRHLPGQHDQSKHGKGGGFGPFGLGVGGAAPEGGPDGMPVAAEGTDKLIEPAQGFGHHAVLRLPPDVRKKSIASFNKMGVTRDEAVRNMNDLADAGVKKHGIAKMVEDAKWYRREHVRALADAKDLDAPADRYIAGLCALSSGAKWETTNRKAGMALARAMNPKNPHVITAKEAAWINKKLADDDGKNATDFRVKPGMTSLEAYKGNPRAAGYLVGHLSGTGKRSYSPYHNGVKAFVDGPETLDGGKIRSFYNNLTVPGAGIHVTNDVWHMRGMKGGVKKGKEWEDAIRSLEGTGKVFHPDDAKLPEKDRRVLFKAKPLVSRYTGPPTKNGVQVGGYPIMTHVTRRATRDFNKKYGTNLLPEEYQAMIWIYGRSNPGGSVKKAHLPKSLVGKPKSEWAAIAARVGGDPFADDPGA